MKFLPSFKASTSAKPIVDAAEPADDTVEEPYVKGTNVEGLSDRRYKWAAYIFATISMSLLFAVVSLAFAIAAMLPLKEIVPLPIEFGPASDVVTIVHSLSKSTRGLDKLTESLCRQYVIQRYAIVRDEDVMKERWGPDGFIHLASDDAEWGRFVREVVVPYKELKLKDTTRDIHIHSSSRIGPKIYRVDFQSSERASDGKVNVSTVRDYVATCP
ncbi:MAG TPA: VirB8/TrbF family protein, partial [Chloroflexota bacterium]|nr:VirB8/TrbF family protein [Chloroflexota bacterium]